jgi:hypothetical protein
LDTNEEIDLGEAMDTYVRPSVHMRRLCVLPLRCRFGGGREDY